MIPEWFTSSERRFRNRTLKENPRTTFLVKLCVGNVFLRYVLSALTVLKVYPQIRKSSRRRADNPAGVRAIHVRNYQLFYLECSIAWLLSCCCLPTTIVCCSASLLPVHKQCARSSSNGKACGGGTGGLPHGHQSLDTLPCRALSTRVYPCLSLPSCLSHSCVPAPLALISHATWPEEKELDFGRFSTPPDRDNKAFCTI